MSNELPKWSVSDERVEWIDFLEDVGAGIETTVRGHTGGPSRRELLLPDLDLYCWRCKCWIRSFSQWNPPALDTNTGRTDLVLRYYCTSCTAEVKRFAIQVCYVGLADDQATLGYAVKIGEFPSFKPRIPTRLRTLLGGDFDLFRQGRLAESVGLGVGAVAYYRRMVEQQKNRWLQSVRDVAEREGTAEILPLIDQAIHETQFTKAMSLISGAFPESLRIRNENPAALLHAVLSEGIHDTDDAECLKLCRYVRNVLTEFANKLDQALKDDGEIKESIAALVARRAAQAVKRKTVE
jgi:hypothetical protein